MSTNGENNDDDEDTATAAAAAVGAGWASAGSGHGREGTDTESHAAADEGEDHLGGRTSSRGSGSRWGLISDSGGNFWCSVLMSPF